MCTFKKLSSSYSLEESFYHSVSACLILLFPVSTSSSVVSQQEPNLIPSRAQHIYFIFSLVHGNMQTVTFGMKVIRERKTLTLLKDGIVKNQKKRRRKPSREEALTLFFMTYGTVVACLLISLPLCRYVFVDRRRPFAPPSTYVGRQRSLPTTNTSLVLPRRLDRSARQPCLQMTIYVSL